jgi:hypothetical protein
VGATAVGRVEKQKGLFLYKCSEGREKQKPGGEKNPIFCTLGKIKIGWQLRFDILVLRSCCFCRNGEKINKWNRRCYTQEEYKHRLVVC